MIAKIIPIFVLLVATHQAKLEEKPVELQKPQNPKAGATPDTPATASEKLAPLSGVDPNSAKCDPAGKIFLLLPHFSDCSKFFMCDHGQEVEFSCAPGGLYFDFALQTCNWAWATQCILRTPPQDEIEGSGEDDFSWLTDHAESQSESLPIKLDHDGGHYRSSPVDTSDITDVSDELPTMKEVANFLQIELSNVAIERCVVGTLTGDAVSNSVRPTSLEYSGPSYNGALNCMRADSASRMIPYKNDCQRYWHCVNGVAKTAYCSDGLYFNVFTQQCDFEANVKCFVEQEDELKSEFLLSK